MALPRFALTATAFLAFAATTTLVGAQPGPYPLWTFPTPVRTGAPTWYKDMVYVMPFEFSEGGTMLDMLYAINATTGQQVFTVPFTALDNNRTNDWKGIAPAVTEVNLAKAGEPENNRIVVMFGWHEDFKVYAVDGLTGAPLWQRHTWPLGCGILSCQITGTSSPVPGAFIVEQPAFLVSLNARDGTVNWNVSVYDNDGNPGSWRSHIAPVNSGSFIWSTRDYVHKIDAYTGGNLWSTQFTPPSCGSGLGCVVTAYNPPVVVGEYVYVSGWTNGNGNMGVLMCIYELTGRVKWSASPSNWSSWVGANRNFAVTEDGENNVGPINGIYSYNATTGKFLWRLNWNTSTYASAVAVDPHSNNVAFALNDNTQILYVYDGVTGALVGSMGTNIHEQFAWSMSGSAFVASLSQSGSTGVTAIYIGSGS